MLRFLYLRTSNVHQHTFNGSRVITLLEDTDSRSWSTKLVRIKHVDLIQFLSGWLTYAADNVKARIPPRVWKMFGFYFIKRFWNAKVTNLRVFHPPSIHKLWKWLCICGNEATIDSHHGSGVKLIILVPAAKHNGQLVDLAQWLPKYGSKPKQQRRSVKKWTMPRRSKPELCIFNVTIACLCL